LSALDGCWTSPSRSPPEGSTGRGPAGLVPSENWVAPIFNGQGDGVADIMIRLDGLHTLGAPDLLL
jgi:hypothetical protein